MNGLTYSSGDVVNGSFEYQGHINLSINMSFSKSAPINDSNSILLSLTVGAHVAINEDATVSSMVLPAGVWPIKIPKGATISVVKLTGSDDGQASIIIPR